MQKGIIGKKIGMTQIFDEKGKLLTGGTVDACGDHRIAMLAAIASARCDVRLRGAECVEKSDPHFWQTLAGLRSGTEERR